MHTPTQECPNEPQSFDEVLAAFGLRHADADADADSAPDVPCYLWPCNVRTFQIWQRVQTQWRTGGMGEKTGLDYEAVILYLQQVERIRPRAHREVFRGLQAMEFAVLEVWAEKSD